MTFLAGWRLAFLVAPVALLAAYLLVARRRPRVSVRFTSVDLLASVAPRRPGWQRHVGAGLLLVSLAVLVLGFADPARAVRTAKQRATIVLVVDTSGSMAATDVAPTRLAAAQAGARTFVDALPSGVQIGLEHFSTSPQIDVAPTADRSTVLAAIDRLQPGGGTDTSDALTLALGAIKALPPGADGKVVPAAIVLESDGSPTITSTGGSPVTAATDAAAAAKAAGIPVDTIAYGTAEGVVTVQGEAVPVPSDPDTMAAIAAAGGGHTFTASSASQLESVYGEIGRVVGYDTHLRSISAWFTGAALAGLVAAAAAGLAWGARIP